MRPESRRVEPRRDARGPQYAHGEDAASLRLEGHRQRQPGSQGVDAQVFDAEQLQASRRTTLQRMSQATGPGTRLMERAPFLALHGFACSSRRHLVLGQSVRRVSTLRRSVPPGPFAGRSLDDRKTARPPGAAAGRCPKAPGVSRSLGHSRRSRYRLLFIAATFG